MNAKVKKNCHFITTELSQDFSQIPCTVLYETATNKRGYSNFMLNGTPRCNQKNNGFSFLFPGAVPQRGRWIPWSHIITGDQILVFVCWDLMAQRPGIANDGCYQSQDQLGPWGHHSPNWWTPVVYVQRNVDAQLKHSNHLMSGDMLIHQIHQKFKTLQYFGKQPFLPLFRLGPLKRCSNLHLASPNGHLDYLPQSFNSLTLCKHSFQPMRFFRILGMLHKISSLLHMLV